MEPIIAPIKTGDTGAIVANLQDALLALLEQKKILQPPGTTGLPTPDELQKLTEGLKQERDQSQFGKVTLQLIIYFQVQQGLPGNVRDLGVEEKTAAKLNDLLKTIGALGGDTFLIVRGTVTTADDQPIRGASVIAFDRDLRKLQQFAKAETNERGEFTMSYDAAKFASGDVPSAPTPKLIVRAFVGDQQIGDDVSRPHPTRDEVVNFKTLAPSVTVVSEWEQLSTSVMPLLEGQGKDDQALPPWEVNDGDLDFIAEETGLDREHIRLWTLAFVVGRDAAAAMQPATGLGAVPGMATTAFFHPAVTDHLSVFAIFYGWFRLGLPTEPVALWATPTEKLLTTLSAAIAQAIIPSNIGADLDSISKLIEQIQLDRVLQAPALGTGARLGDLLALSPTRLSPDQQRALAAAVTDLRLDDPQLHKQIAKLPGFEGVGVAAGVARTLRLGALTGGHLPLAQELQGRLQHAEETEGTLRPLAALRPDEWLDLAYTHGTPEGITISPVAYADALSASVEQQHPNATLAAHFTDGRRLARHPALTDVGTFLSDNTDFNIVTANLNAVTDQAKLGGILEPRHAPLVAGLRSLQRMNVLGASWDETATLLESDLYSPHQLLVAGPTQFAALLDGRIAPERAAALYRQAENLHSTTIAAFTAGFSPLSAPRIMPTVKFGIPPGADDGPVGTVPPAGPPSGGGIPNTADPTGSVKLAELADAVAHQMANRDRALDPGWGRVVPPPRTGIVIPDNTPHFSPGSVIDHQPTLQALFGSQDACACGHCSSVLSPAAYFVDVLEFIKNANLDYILLGNPGLGFPGRRPDLQDIELSCNNTNTVVPAIDLALEILENAVALPLPVDLQLGTKVEDQLRGLGVGPEVRKALGKTVRTLPAVVQATQDTPGGADWTVVDGHRRWKLTAQAEDALKWRIGNGPAQPFDTTGVNLSELMAALDLREVPKDAEARFSPLFAANQNNQDFRDYKVTIEPLPLGASHSWRVRYQFAAQLLISANQLTLQTIEGVVWLQREVGERALAEVGKDLAKKTVPPLVQKLLASKFANAGNLTIKADAGNLTIKADSGDPRVWTIASNERELTLGFIPAQLNITSLTYQSGDPDADPVAWPENHNPAAYEKLKGEGAVFPWSLPVDLPLEEVRLFLERARSSRLKLIELSMPLDQPLGNSPVFALELLGLSQAEARLIAQPPLDLYKCWGVSSGQTTLWDASAGGMVTGTSPLVLLKYVSILLQQSRLSFEELQAVFATQFVQGGAGPLVIEPQNICKPSEMTVANLTTGHLDRIHRFTRLWRKLGWTMRELDLAIQAFGGQLTPDTLIGLARLQQLNQQLELPVASLVGGIHLLETQPWTDYLTDGATDHPSLYATIFQREAVRAVSDFADFALQSDGKKLKNENLSISARADYIGACLRTKPSVVKDWVLATQGLGIEDKLNLANLSRLTAAAGLCRALNIAPDKLTHHLKLYGATASPFQSVLSANDRAKATLEFVKQLLSIERSGVEVETLRYLLQHYTAPGANVGLDEKQLTADLAEAAREAVRSIPDAPEKTPPVAPAGPEEAVRIAQDNAALVLAVRVARENAVITALATGLGAARELVDDLLRIRLRNPANLDKAAIEVFLSPLGDFIDLSSLVGKLYTNSDPVSAYLWNAFSAADRLVLTHPASTVLEQQTTLVAALNQVLQGASIYEASRFAGVNLSRETLALISASPTGANLMRLNRLLLEEAYAPEIAKRRLPDMLFVAGDVSQPLRAAVESVLVRLRKTTLLCDALKLSRADLPLLRTSATDIYSFTALDFNTLPVASGTTPGSIVGFEQLLALAKLRGLASGAGDLLHQYAALNFLPPAPPAVWNAEAVFQVLMKALTLTRDDIEAAANQLRIITADQYRDPIVLTRLIELLAALKQLGATVKQATDLTAPSPHDAAAISARELLRSKYGESQWHDLIKPIADQLRVWQRDALVDYLINFNQLRGADDLYEHYLIDVQTSSCLKTTRLLLATAAVQLFVQRVLLNLEKSVSLSDDKRKLWDWMHNYRVWEANRKVFLYPENWLLPELRDDKTATFRQMESALTEKEPSPAITRSALLGYLEELGDLAQINVIAMYEDRKKQPGTLEEEHTLYVVGRTPNTPYRYFWRSCAHFGDEKMSSWSGWEALELDNANDFIMPFVLDGDLHVAWPVFRKTTGQQIPKTTDEESLTLPPPLLWEVTIAWQRRTGKGWTKRKLGHEALPVPRLREITELRSFVFRMRKDDVPVPMASNLRQETITIDCYAAIDPAYPKEYGEKTEDFQKPGLKDDSWHEGRYNVALTVSGQVWEKYKLTPSDSGYTFRPAETVIVKLQWGHKNNGGGVDWHESPGSVETNGNLSFPEAATQLESVTNGGKVTLIFSRNGHELKTLIGDIGDSYNHISWSWTPTLVFEIPRPTNYPFGPNRPVEFTEASGCFVLTATRDMEVLNPAPPPPNTPKLDKLTGIQRLGNRFICTSPGQVVPFPGDVSPDVEPFPSSSPTRQQVRDHSTLTVDHDVGSQLEITPATLANGVPADSPYYKSRPWYVRDATGRYYVRRKYDDPRVVFAWQVWPDGQDFVGWYRAVAAASTFALFEPAIQAMPRDGQLPLLPAPLPPPYSTTSRQISFDRTAPYANYNWELFLHAPLAIADYLANQQRFEEARRWLHAIFDPTTEKKDKKTNQIPQFWRFLPFDNATQPEAIAKLLTWLANPSALPAEARTDFGRDFGHQIDEWEKNPFMPHVIARLRPSAYQWHTFFAYLEVLIGWGDQLFRRDTRESVNDATLLYVLAAKLLGPRPRTIPAPTPPYALTYRLLQGDPNKIDSFSNAWVDYADLPGVKQLARARTGRSRSSQSFALLKSDQPSDHLPLPVPDISSAVQHLSSLSALAFCVPQNEKVTEFYDRVENRLFNVRNCRNIEGVFRDLPLYEPPIDPLLLIRARAAGLTIDSVLADLYAPLPNYRFTFTLQKALELCAELKALGGALLTALEKKDAEELTLLRSGHEIAMLKLVRDTRKQQIAEAEANIAALQQSEETILERFGQYQKLLGKPSITKGQDGLPVVEQSSSLTVSTDPVGGASGLGLSRMEVDQLGLTAIAHMHTQAASSGHIVAGILNLFPNIWAGGIFAGQTFGGTNLGSAATAIAKSIEMVAAEANYLANQAGTFGGYERRQDEWVHQSKLALAELKQIQKQIVAAEIRKDIAERELSNHDTQIDNAQEVEDFMRSKFTSQQLYRWMSSQIAQVYFRTYQLALDQARRAERTYQHELGLDDATAPFVKITNWDSLKGGLLAGEHLHHDLKRMESAYLERNVREFEITKHISLLQIDPGALIALRQTGKCDFSLPEVLFDLDYPGHYMRRIKMVSLSIPCVAGPYASVSATLRLIKNEIRAKPTASASDSYARLTESEDDPRFMKATAAITAVVTSGAQQDSGMFEPNLRDERYLPFEGAGVISTWRIELPEAFHAFDYESIADVVLHVRYTARNSDDLKKMVSKNLNSAINAIQLEADRIANNKDVGMARLFSLRREFPTEWYQLVDPANPGSTAFAITKNRFPFLFAAKDLKISAVDFFAVPKSDAKGPVFRMTVTPPNSTENPLSWKASDIGPKTLTWTTAGVRVDETSIWRLEILKDVLVEVTEFQKDIDDMLVICHYTIN